MGPTSNEQPNAPYLEAVVAYAFRGTARYHVPGHKGGPGADPGLRKAIGVDALAAEGRRGWHLVDCGPFYLALERSAQQWEHRRTTLPSRTAQRRLEADGWAAVGTWFPFRYFKRALDAPADGAAADG